MEGTHILTVERRTSREGTSSSPKTSSGKHKPRKAAKQPTEYWGSLPAISGRKTKN